MNKMDITVDITQEDERWELLAAEAGVHPLEEWISDTVRRTLMHVKQAGNAAISALPPMIEISVVLASDETVRVLNRDYRGKDKPTNVLSFPLIDEWQQDGATPLLHFPAGEQAPALALGDIVLAYQVIREEAQAQKKAWPDHVRHLLVHSMLHLLGYDHEDEHEAEEMEETEIAILRAFGIENPYSEKHAAL